MARGAGRCSAALPERPPRRSCRPLHPVRGGIPPMEQLLIKMARQLDALDEASLLALWDKYAVIVSHFEPTKRWEEAALVFSFIQAKRWKNQLFNYSWSAQASRRGVAARRGAGLFSGPANGQACSCEAQAQSRDYPVPPAPQSREGCLRRARRKRLRPQENRFFRPIHVDDPAEPL